MSDDEQTSGPTGSGFGSGTLSKITSFIYWHLIVAVLMCVASLPVVALLLLLARASGNLPLVPLVLILYGPVLSAALYALRDRTRVDELTPARSFLKGIRIGWLDALKAWTPAMLLLAVIVGGLTVSGAAIGGAVFGVLVMIGVIVLLWGVNALTIATFFSFRGIDIARLAIYYIGRRWIGTLGELALLVVATALVSFTSEGALWLFAGIFAAFLWSIVQPLVADVEATFTAGGA